MNCPKNPSYREMAENVYKASQNLLSSAQTISRQSNVQPLQMLYMLKEKKVSNKRNQVFSPCLDNQSAT